MTIVDWRRIFLLYYCEECPLLLWREGKKVTLMDHRHYFIEQNRSPLVVRHICICTHLKYGNRLSRDWNISTKSHIRTNRKNVSTLGGSIAAFKSKMCCFNSKRLRQTSKWTPNNARVIALWLKRIFRKTIRHLAKASGANDHSAGRCAEGRHW